jgi:hypothetical protein
MAEPPYRTILREDKQYLVLPANVAGCRLMIALAMTVVERRNA